VLGLLMVLITAAVVYDTITISSDHRVQGTLRVTVGQLHRDQAELSVDRSRIASVTSTLSSRLSGTTRVSEEDASTRQSLASSVRTDDLQSLDIATLRTCLTGVSTAVGAIATSNLQGAVDSITSASSACRLLDATSGGLAYPFDFPDPFILPVGDEYYAFATNSAAGNIQIIESSDLAHWTTVGDALPHVAAWAKPGATWAPSVLHLGDTYVLYYSAVFLGTGEQCISAATASQPQGPFTDTSTIPVACQLTDGGSIDPSPYVDASGTPYLTWKSEGGGGRPPTIWAQQLGPDGTGLLPGAPTALLQPTVAWQGGVVEGPDMVDLDGQYELFYSGNDWSTAGYAVGVAACVGPLGPCPPSDAPPVLSSGASFSGPGGASVFTDAQGTVWMAFHAWLPGEVGFPHSRVLFLRRVTITAGVPTVEP
jgi:beta-xylosidase